MITQVSNNTANINTLQTQVNNLQTQVTQNHVAALQGIATVAAIAGLPAIDAGKQFSMGMAGSTYMSVSALAIGAQARFTRNITGKMTYSTSGSNSTTTVGMGYSW